VGPGGVAPAAGRVVRLLIQEVPRVRGEVAPEGEGRREWKGSATFRTTWSSEAQNNKHKTTNREEATGIHTSRLDFGNKKKILVGENSQYPLTTNPQWE